MADDGRKFTALAPSVIRARVFSSTTRIRSMTRAWRGTPVEAQKPGTWLAQSCPSILAPRTTAQRQKSDGKFISPHNVPNIQTWAMPKLPSLPRREDRHGDQGFVRTGPSAKPRNSCGWQISRPRPAPAVKGSRLGGGPERPADLKRDASSVRMGAAYQGLSDASRPPARNGAKPRQNIPGGLTARTRVRRSTRGPRVSVRADRGQPSILREQQGLTAFCSPQTRVRPIAP